MGVFKCAQCDRSYWDRRFIWESDPVTDLSEVGCLNRPRKQSGSASSSSAAPTTVPDCPEGQPARPGLDSDDPATATDTATATAAAAAAAVTARARSWSNPETSFEAFCSDSEESDEAGDHKSSSSGSNSREDRRAKQKGELAQRLEMLLELRDKDGKLGQGGWTSTEGESLAPAGKVYADAVRATGTMANLTGSFVSSAAHVCAPISSVAGVVGATSGAVQLYQGFATPSGNIDPHLVAKGGITASIGGTCMILGACAAAMPPLFIVALGLGLSGVGAAALVDSVMPGLCPECREAGEASSGSEHCDRGTQGAEGAGHAELHSGKITDHDDVVDDDDDAKSDAGDDVVGDDPSKAPKLPATTGNDDQSTSSWWPWSS